MSIFINYFKVAFRNLLRQKTHSLINILGLSAGLCFSLLIALYVMFELSYDDFHSKGSRICLLPMTWHFNGTDVSTGANCSAGGPFMKEAFPQVEHSVRIKSTSLTFRKESEAIHEPAIYFADSTFFDIFSFSFLQGNPKKALSAPNTIVLTERLAQKYFGTEWSGMDILNQTLTGTNNKLYRITGVIRNVPSNSHLKFDAVASFSTLPVAYRQPSWDNSEFYTYVLLVPDANVRQIVEQIPGRLEKAYGAWAKEGVELDLVRLNDIYLRNLKYKLPNTSDERYVMIFMGIAILILVVATFNYINLSTARSMERALEVGVRKVMGAVRFQLFNQFMSESILVTSFSLVLAIGLSVLALPLFNSVMGISLDATILSDYRILLTLLTSGIVISLIAGIYPSLVLSNYLPSRVLKGKLKDSLQGIKLRSRLVIVQFSISIILIISALTISSQLDFLRAKDPGYERDRIVAVSLDSISRTRVAAFKTKALAQPWITSVSAVTQLPVNITFETALSVKGSDERRLIRVAPVDEDYLKTMELQTIAGTGFSESSEARAEGWEVILNESALGFFGWTREEAIGKELRLWEAPGVVKGVVQDFHFSSLHNPIVPLVIFAGKGLQHSNMLIRVDAGFQSNLAESVKTLWKEVNQDSPFILTYLNERYELLYESEMTMSRIVNLFATLAALVSGLGLFGLASYSILQRTKELGIRKVLGASSNQIVLLVSGSFVKQVLIAFLLAAPLSYFLMIRWLNDFNYKIDFNWVLVVLAGVTAMLLALITVAYHSVQVAGKNPVDSLRSE